MAKFMTAARNFVQGEEGATMVEYGLMLALIATVCIVAVTTIGKSANTLFTNIGTSLTTAA